MAGTAVGGSGVGGSSVGGAGGSGGSLDPNAIVPGFDGFYWEGTCNGASTEAGRDCKLLDDTMQCPNATSTTPFSMRGAFRRKTLTVAGTPGTKYMINFHVRGVTGGKFYTGGTLRATTYTDGPAGNDGWYEGGTPTDSKWNTYEIHVDPAVPGAKNVYYMNAFPTASGYDGRHETFVMKFNASFPVLGGGKITFVIHDSNCLGQQNCGQNLDSTCTAPRSVDLNGMSPAATFAQPVVNNVAGGTWHPQWLYFDILSVVQQ